MTQATVPGYVYTVYTATGCTVTAPGFPAFSVTCSPGMANSFTAPGDKVEISDSAATLVAVRTFNCALAALGLLGEGNTLPAGYTRLEYLAATGVQYIDTGFPLSSEIDVLVDFAPEFTGSAHVLFGTRRDDLGTNRGAYAQIMPTSGQIVIWRNTRRIALQGVSQARHRLVLTGASLVLDGAVKSTYTEDPWSYTLPCFIGAAITHAGVASLPLVGRLYGFRLTQSGSLKLNLVPARDTTGAPCMFDLVTRTPFYNSGTGDFVTPQAAASTYSLRGRRVLPDWGKLTPTGLRRLYHVPEGYQGDMLRYAAENGFCPIQEEPQPEEGFWAPKWGEVAGVIYLRWVETAPPEELATGKE